MESLEGFYNNHRRLTDMTRRNTARECLGWWCMSGEASVQVRTELITPPFTPTSDQSLTPSSCNNLGPSSPTLFHTNKLHPLAIPDLLSFSHPSSSDNTGCLFWSHSAQPHSSPSLTSSQASLDPSLSQHPSNLSSPHTFAAVTALLPS